MAFLNFGKKNNNFVNLEKSTETLEKSFVILEKKSKINLNKHNARVGVVLDYSGSMAGLYNNNTMQKTLERLMPIALKFDDNGELDTWLFTNSYKRLDSINVDNYSTYIDNIIKKSNFPMGMTSYAPVLEDVLKFYFQENVSNTPVFLIYITDGENDDKLRMNEVVRKSAEQNIFIQFVGIGNETFNYLQQLDTLDNRKCDNTSFLKIQDINKINDENLYIKLLGEYPEWLKL